MFRVVFDLGMGVGSELLCQAYPASLCSLSAYQIQLGTVLGTRGRSRISPGAPSPTTAAKEHGRISLGLTIVLPVCESQLAYLSRVLGCLFDEI